MLQAERKQLLRALHVCHEHREYKCRLLQRAGHHTHHSLGRVRTILELRIRNERRVADPGRAMVFILDGIS